jgi:hypothetical protein
LHLVGDLFELNVKLWCQNVKLSKAVTGTARSIAYGEWRRHALLKNRSDGVFGKLISHI